MKNTQIHNGRKFEGTEISPMKNMQIHNGRKFEGTEISPMKTRKYITEENLRAQK